MSRTPDRTALLVLRDLFVPRDFDVSPYFAIVKPSLSAGFNHRTLSWRVPAGQSAGAENRPAIQQGALG